jgi:hypothetical protein
MSGEDPIEKGGPGVEIDHSIAELPAPDTQRWVARRKAIVVHAVRSGLISLQEACRRYNLSVEEFLAWQRAIERHGIPGLRVTRLQVYRDTDEPTKYPQSQQPLDDRVPDDFPIAGTVPKS